MYNLVVVVTGALIAVETVIRALIFTFVYCYNVNVGLKATAVKYPSI
jgi:hypothetical protein